MSYEIAFLMLISFLAGRYIPRKIYIYIGNDETNYNKANFGILFPK